MADPFVGEIRVFPYTYTPMGWLECNGAIYPFAEYQLLFVLIGNLYGGDQTKGTFAVPDLRGRAVAGLGPQMPFQQLGSQGGEETVTLNVNQIPSHNHVMSTDFEGYKLSPSSFSNVPTAGESYPSRYVQPTSPTTANTYQAYNAAIGSNPTHLALQALPPFGSGGPHENRQPYVVLRFGICFDGTYPYFN